MPRPWVTHNVSAGTRVCPGPIAGGTHRLMPFGVMRVVDDAAVIFAFVLWVAGGLAGLAGSCCRLFGVGRRLPAWLGWCATAVAVVFAVFAVCFWFIDPSKVTPIRPVLVLVVVPGALGAMSFWLPVLRRREGES